MLVAHSGVVQNFQVAEVPSQLMPVLDGCDVLEEVLLAILLLSEKISSLVSFCHK